MSADKLAQAYELGAKGGAVGDDERLAFEEWMRGHCWALCATWDGKHYRSDAEQTGWPDPQAMMTRRLWAVWRDRAALAAHQAEQPAHAPGWKWVPVEPTDAMLEAASRVPVDPTWSMHGEYEYTVFGGGIWAAMLAAAPQQGGKT